MKHVYPAGPKNRFPLANARLFSGDRLKFLLGNRDTFGDIAHFKILGRHIFQLNNPDYIQYVLVRHPEQFNKTPNLKRSTKKTIGEGLLTSEGEFHKRQRKLVQPAFHHKRIATYADLMVNYTTAMLDGWHTGDQRDIHHEMMKLTMQIVAKALFDADVSSDADAIGHAITVGIESASKRTMQAVSMPEWVPTAENAERRRATSLLNDTIYGMIAERRQSSEDKGDLLSMLLMAVDEDDGGQMTDKQVHDEAMTLFIAGHETTANALSWTLYLLSQHPEIEAKLLEELRTVLGGRAPTMADLPRLVYTDMVIKESMRLYPPAWIIGRLAMEDVDLGGYHIPKGSIVIMSPYVMHHDARYFEQPEAFRPERFAPGYEERLPKYAYFPFGGGPRVCVGNQFAMMEANLVLATIAQRFHVSLAPGQPVEMQPMITLRPRGSLRMTLTEREPAAIAAV
jgi:cytochrome P450